MKLIIMCALTKRRVIGKDGKIPWHLSEDLKRFKRITTGHAVLMGRKTYESIGKPLAHRRNIVVSSTAHDREKRGEGVEWYQSVAEALAAARDMEKVFIIGGGTLYAQLLDKADEFLLTIVDQEIPGDTYFPPYEHLIGAQLRLMKQEVHSGFTFIDYERQKIP